MPETEEITICYADKSILTLTVLKHSWSTELGVLTYASPEGQPYYLSPAFWSQVVPGAHAKNWRQLKEML